MADEPIIVVPVPPLVIQLFHLEKQKGVPPSEAEVLKARDSAICMTMPVSERDELARQRGYDDISPENVWQEWQAARVRLLD